MPYVGRTSDFVPPEESLGKATVQIMPRISVKCSKASVNTKKIKK